MKKIFLFVSVFILTGFSYATIAQNQVPKSVTTDPIAFKARDSITITVDLSGTKFDGQTQLYMWAFLNGPANPFPQSEPKGVSGGNGSWGASNEALKMKSLGNGKWQFGMRPTTFFAESVANVIEIGFLVKTKDGTIQTDNIYLRPDPVVFKETEFRVFPPKADASDVVTLNYNQDLASSVETSRVNISEVQIAAFKENDGVDVQVDVTKTATNLVKANKLYSFSLVPASFFTIPANTQIKKIKYRFGGSLVGATGKVYSDWATYDFSTLTY